MNTSRRRFLGITAAVSAGALLPQAWAQSPQPVIWQGVALGAAAELRLYHPNRAAAEGLIQQALAEVSRLEQIFSIYNENSQLSQLNRAGSLNAIGRKSVVGDVGRAREKFGVNQSDIFVMNGVPPQHATL